MRKPLTSLTTAILALCSFWLAAQAATAININPGETASGVLAVGQTNFYSITGASNDVVTVLLTASVAQNPVVELRGPQGNLLATGANIGGVSSFISAQLLPTNGTYQLLVHDDGGNETYSYGVTLVKYPGPNV